MMESIDKIHGTIDLARNGMYSSRRALFADILRAADEVEQEIADNYMKLPLDADGVTIHVGDKMLDDIQREVVAVSESSFVLSGYGIGCNLRICGAHLHSHVKPRTIEDVLKEVADEVCGFEELEIEKYAAEIRKLMGVEE